MDTKIIINFLWDLKNRQSKKNEFKNTDLEKIDYVKNAIYSRSLFKIMDISFSKEELKNQLNKLYKDKPLIQKWVEEMSIQQDKFYKILQLNLIKERAKN